MANSRPVVSETRQKSSPLRSILASCRHILLALAVVSGVINILMLTGSIFMMQVYDRVLSSNSVPTLLALSLIAIGAYLFLGILDVLRSRVLILVGERIDISLGSKINEAVVNLPSQLVQERQEAVQPLRDLETIRAFFARPGLVSLFDLPWVPIFLIVVFLLHPLLGWLATAGAGVLIVLTLVTELRSKAPTAKALKLQSARNRFVEEAGRGGDVIKAMGMLPAFAARWQEQQIAHLRAQRKSGYVIRGMAAVSRMFRMILQSAVLGAGAYFAILGEISAGTIIAASIISARALAPIDQAIANWRGFVAARQSNARLVRLLPLLDETNERFALPAPSQTLSVENLSVCAPGTSTTLVRRISMQLKAGDGLGIIGPSAAGKSTLARALVGVWPAKTGRVLLDGARMDQWNSDFLGPAIGYLPQDVQLFDGSIAENISRFSPNASPDEVIAAATAAGFHEHILDFADGYETQVGRDGVQLSAGQRQRLGLARSLFRDPFLVVLDEPNANLDADGEAAVNRAIQSVRERAGLVIVIAHRPSAIAGVNLLLALREGECVAFGAKETVLSRTVQNAGKIVAHEGARSDGFKVVQEA